jgi:opacity protein-like surface antigen
MPFKPALAFVALCALGLAAKADDLPAPKLPSFAANPQPLSASPQTASPWSGLYVGSEAFAVSRKGAKGLVGGSAFVGYHREFDNNVVVGVEASTGLARSFRHSPFVSYDYAATNLKLGYDMGRLMPFVTAGFVFAKPLTGRGGYVSATDSINDLFNSPSSIRTFGTIGAGFDYAVTDKLSVGLAVSAGNGRGLVAP